MITVAFSDDLFKKTAVGWRRPESADAALDPHAVHTNEPPTYTQLK